MSVTNSSFGGLGSGFTGFKLGLKEKFASQERMQLLHSLEGDFSSTALKEHP